MRTTTLGGLSVDDWLTQNTPAPVTPAPSSDAAQDGPPAARMPRVARTGAWATRAAGLALGLMLALPALAGTGSCPPPGEGATYCHLQHDVLRAVMTLLLVMLATEVVRRAITGLPGVVRRMRGEGLFPTSPPPDPRDALLVAACHGRVA